MWKESLLLVPAILDSIAATLTCVSQQKVFTAFQSPCSVETSASILVVGDDVYLSELPPHLNGFIRDRHSPTGILPCPRPARG